MPVSGGMFSIDVDPSETIALHPGLLLVLCSSWGFSSMNARKRKRTRRFLDVIASPVSKLQLHISRDLQDVPPAPAVFPPSHTFHILSADYFPPTTTVTIAFPCSQMFHQLPIHTLPTVPAPSWAIARPLESLLLGSPFPGLTWKSFHHFQAHFQTLPPPWSLPFDLHSISWELPF